MGTVRLLLTSPPLGWITSTIEVGGSRTGGTSLSMASTGPARLTRSRDSDADAPAAPRRSDPPGSRWALTRSPMPPRSVGVTMGSGNVRLLLNVTTLGWITSTLEVAGSRIGGTSLSMASAGSPDSRPRPRLGRNQNISRPQARQVHPSPAGRGPHLPLDCRSPLAGFDPRQRLRLNTTRRDFVPAYD